MPSLIPDSTFDRVGKILSIRTGLVAAAQIRKFVVAVDDPDPLYIDASAARRAGYPDIIAPPLYAAAVTRPIPEHAAIAEDGQFAGIAPPGMEAFQTILASQKWEFGRPVVTGENLTETVRLLSVIQKEGKQGPFVLAQTETIIVAGVDTVERSVLTLALRSRSDLAPAPAADELSLARPSQGGRASEFRDGVLIKRADMVSVFMFCAATWAVHRIHYDSDYARTEGLASPIVPGWMLASYSAQLVSASMAVGRRLASLEVRYKKSAAVGDVLHCAVVAREGEDALDLVIRDQTGGEVATAQATTALGHRLIVSQPDAD